MTLIDDLRQALGGAHVLTGPKADPWSRDWIGKYAWAPLCVARPASTAEVASVLRLARQHGAPVVPVGGNTGLSGGTAGEGAVMLSLDRMRRIAEIRPSARIAIVEAGVVLDQLNAAAAESGLRWPVTFGARGSATIGGILSTNAGGSNVLRFGNARANCLGLEVVRADGEVLDLMSELHKDNSGYDLRDLFIGAEGTLGIITRAVLRLAPLPRAHATAMVAVNSLAGALRLLNRLQDETGGAVEAFEYMPRGYIEAHLARFPEAREPFAEPHEVNILVELATTARAEAEPGPDGRVPLAARLEETLAELAAEGVVLDATLATSEAQRAEMWARREAAGELTLGRKPLVDNDIAVPIDAVESFLARIEDRLEQMAPGAETLCVAHLGDGNIHFAIYPAQEDPALLDSLREAVEDEVRTLGGSFSAEHGVGLTKLPSMARRKDPVALDTMGRIKAALDPEGLLNPGKILPRPPG